MPKKAANLQYPQQGKNQQWALPLLKPSEKELSALLEFLDSRFALKCSKEDLRALCAATRSLPMCFCLLQDLAQQKAGQFESFSQISSAVASAYEASKRQRNALLDSFQSGAFSKLLQHDTKLSRDDINRLFIVGGGSQTSALLYELIEDISEEEDEEFRFSSVEEILGVIRPIEQLSEDKAKDIESTEWYYRDKAGAKKGPLTTEELEPLLKKGVVTEKNLFYSVSSESEHKPWFVIDNDGLTRGPLSESMVEQGLERGNFTADSHGYCQGMDGWKVLWKSDLSKRIDLIPFVPGLEAEGVVTTESRKTSQAPRRSGDLANSIVVVNALVFLLFVCYKRNIFSASFQADGFCISFETEPLLQSHILCVYADFFFAVLVFLLYLFNRSLSGVIFLKHSAFAILGHGIGHWITWKYPLEGNSPMLHSSQWTQFNSQEKALVVAAALLFWFGFFQATHAPILHQLFHATWNAFVLLSFVPNNLGFTYVQTSLLLVFATYEIFRQDKDANYDRVAWYVTFPIGFVAWLESLGCDYFLKAIGGHIWYDLTICVSTMVYFISISCVPLDNTTHKKAN